MSRYGEYGDKAFIAEYYDSLPLTTERADLEFFLSLARETGGPVLELGCGTGRVLLPLAAAGFSVVGLDLSPHMLARCRQKLGWQPPAVQQRVRLVESGMTEFELGERFALVLVPFRSFQLLLSVEEQLACLAAIRRHLAPHLSAARGQSLAGQGAEQKGAGLAEAGRLALTFFQTDLRRTYDPAFLQEAEAAPEKTLPDGRRLRLSERTRAFHRAEQYNEIELFYNITHPDGRVERLTQELTVRYFFPHEIEHLLARAGFRVQARYGDYDRSPLGDDSPEMIFLAAKASLPRLRSGQEGSD